MAAIKAQRVAKKTKAKKTAQQTSANSGAAKARVDKKAAAKKSTSQRGAKQVAARSEPKGGAAKAAKRSGKPSGKRTAKPLATTKPARPGSAKALASKNARATKTSNDLPFARNQSSSAKKSTALGKQRALEKAFAKSVATKLARKTTATKTGPATSAKKLEPKTLGNIKGTKNSAGTKEQKSFGELKEQKSLGEQKSSAEAKERKTLGKPKKVVTQLELADWASAPPAESTTPARDARQLLEQRKAIKKALAPTGDGKAIVDAYMRDVDHPFKAEMEAVRQIILGVSPKLSERIKWNAPSFYYKEDLGAFNPRSSEYAHLILLFPGGGALPEDSPILEGSHKNRREVKFHGMDDVRAKQGALEKIIEDWIEYRDN